MDVDAVADGLYALPPEKFTAARDDAVRAAPDPATRAAVKALRRPTAAAHAVNRLVRDDPDGIDALLDVGDRLREAMTGGGDVRGLGEQRRALLGRLVPPDLPAALRADVTATLEAATADPQLAAAVQSGRLVRPLRYAGFGALPDLDDAVATPLPRAPQRPKRAAPSKPAKPAQLAKPAQPAPAAKREPDADLSALRARVLELAGAADDAQRRYDDAARAAVEARSRLEQAEAARAAAHKAARAAHAEVEQARRELGRLERR